MDYQKAIKEAEIQIDMYESMILYNKDFEPKNDNSNYERKLDFLKTAISAMQELYEYKNKLEQVYGKCEGLLDKVIDALVQFADEVKIGNPIESLLLTDEEVELWKQIKKLGTLEEVQELVELRKEKCPQKVLGAFGGSEYECRNCGNTIPYLEAYCEWCGQKQDWSV